jgi:DNA repair exonuclease SbcCD nuclease subunit
MKVWNSYQEKEDLMNKDSEIVISDEEVAIFTDIHWGKSRDADIKLDIADKFVENLITKCNERKIKTVIFLGDWFDNRNSISVKTLNRAYAALKRITNSGLKIYKIIGNHDCYFKDTGEVNSIEPFSDIEGVTTIKDITKVHFTKGDKYGLFIPWGKMHTTAQDEKYDILFCHFSFMGAQLNNMSIDNESIKSEQLHLIAPKVFTGHLHCQKKYVLKEGEIIAVGSPFELDWGDYENPKGMYILNTKTLQEEFIVNNTGIKHTKIYWSKIKSRVEDFSKVKGNFVKLIIDEEYKFEHIMKILNFINGKQPAKPCETEFVYNTKFCNNLIDEEEESLDNMHLTKKEYMEKFILKSKEKLEGMDIQKLIRIANNYYNECAVKVNYE